MPAQSCVRSGKSTKLGSIFIHAYTTYTYASIFIQSYSGNICIMNLHHYLAQLLLLSLSPPRFKGTGRSKFTRSVGEGLPSEVRFSHFNAPSPLLGHNFTSQSKDLQPTSLEAGSGRHRTSLLALSHIASCISQVRLFSCRRNFSPRNSCPHPPGATQGVRERGRAAGTAVSPGPGGAAAAPVGAGSGRPR